MWRRCGAAAARREIDGLPWWFKGNMTRAVGLLVRETGRRVGVALRREINAKLRRFFP